MPYNVFRPLCFRLAPLAENATAQRSVAHLTLMPSGRLATLRCRLRRQMMVWNINTIPAPLRR
ncbi:MAG: hypothetical protein LBQ66_12305 [Planctomycetaceae bacterium]|nr:hypothetical protein [Planctomycetaceae bacterium]